MACPTETELLDFVEGRLPAQAATALENHIDQCSDCRVVVASLVGNMDRRSKTAPEEPSRMGRFVILGTVGAGGMGLVYSAYDPKLDRKVALKLLRLAAATGGMQEMSARVLREAQAMARLSHPNVVQVYEVGELADRVFVAMELVEGGTLEEWLKTPHTVAEIVALFIQAGQGLAAAHAAGLVHRDFKPANVLVGDGRARVTDFGLAHGAGPELAGVVGTPGYLAPEQQGEGPVDGRADQYAFSVALTRTLQGRAPAWMQAVLQRGQSVDPTDRFGSMGLLLQALGNDPWARRRRWAGMAAGVALLLGMGTVAYRASVHQAHLCDASPTAFAGVWDEGRKAAIHHAFTATGAPFAESAWGAVSRLVDDYTAGWTAMSRDSCQATRMRGEQSDAMLDLRTSCLRTRQEEVKAQSDLFLHADPGIVERSVQAASALTPLDGCADLERLAAKIKPPANAEDAKKAEALRSELVQAKALMDAGVFPRGLALSREALEGARTLGYPPVIAEGQLLTAKLEFRTGDFAAAEKTFREAVLSAEAAGDDDVVAPAWVGESDSLNRIGRYEETLDHCRLARAAVVRLGSPRGLLSELESLVGRTDQTLGRLEEASVHLQDSLALRRRPPENLLAISGSLKDLGVLYQQQGNLPLAQETLESSLAMRESMLGPEHPNVATLLTSLGSVYLDQGDFAKAEDVLEKAIAIRERSLGPAHPDLATSLAGMAALLEKEGKRADALKDFQKALSIRTQALGPDHPDTLEVKREVDRLSGRDSKPL